MGKLTITEKKTGKSKVYDTEKDYIKLTLVMLETGLAYQKITDSQSYSMCEKPR